MEFIKSLSCLLIFFSLAACTKGGGSNKPFENANANVQSAFANLANGSINFQKIDIQGEKCTTVSETEATCEVQSIKLVTSQETFFQQENGAITNIATTFLPDPITLKKDEEITLSGTFSVFQGTVGSSISKVKAWKLSKIALKKI